MSAEVIAALTPLAAALAGVVMAWLERRLERPDTLEDAKTPDSLRARWIDYVRGRLRDQDGGH